MLGLNRMLSENTSAKIEALMQFNDVLGSVNWQQQPTNTYPLNLFVSQS